jgi:vanillate O-demethylase monooxygenase subunit
VQVVCPSFDIAGFAGRQIEGFIDVAHFAWVHTETFADPNNQQVPDYQTSETPTGFMADYFSSMSNYAKGSGFEDPEGFIWLRHFEVHLPFTATLTIHFPGGKVQTIMNAASPVSARKTKLLCRSFAMSTSIFRPRISRHSTCASLRRIVQWSKLKSPNAFHWI